MDNACVHTSSKVVDYFACKGLAVLTLPPYSPEFNPIERVFHNVKKVLKYRSTYERRFEHVLAEVIQEL
jgi:transposase